jgi:transposase
MGLQQRLITAELYNHAQNRLGYVKNKNARAATRLRAIIAAKEHGVTLVAKIFTITSNTLRAWVKRFNDGDLKGLEYRKGRGRTSKISNACRAEIFEWIKQDPTMTVQHIVVRLEETCGFKTSKSAVHRVLRELKLSYITPRPQHYKSDKNRQEEFKKKLKMKW